MRYTKDGTIPSPSNGTFINGKSGTASVTAGQTLKAIAYGTNYSASDVASGNYTALPKAATPTFTPAAGTYPAGDYPKTITIKTTSSGATMRYTKDGSAPTEGHGTLINGSTGSASVTAGQTLKAIAYGTNYSDSNIVSGIYSGVVATPTLSPAGGERCVSPISITITTTTTGCSISYTTDNSTPTPSHGNVVAVSSTTISFPTSTQGRTLKAMAFRTGLTNSAVVSGTYTLINCNGVEPPPDGNAVASPAPGGNDQ